MSMGFKKIAEIAVSAVFAATVSINDAKAEPPLKGSEQWNMLVPYVDFITAMRTKDGRSGCCDMADGRGELDERYVDGHYEVFITKDLYPNAGIPAGGMWIKVDEGRILTPEKALEYCKPIRESKGLDHSCNQPPFNVLWLNVTTKQPYCYIRREPIF